MACLRVLLLASVLPRVIVASADCPCLSTEFLHELVPLVDGSMQMAFPASLSDKAGPCHGCSGIKSPLSAGEWERANASNARLFSYPADYGSSGCSAFDAGLAPFCTASPAPLWCSMPWCYVNTSVCRASEKSMYRSIHLEPTPLYFSYDACAMDPTDAVIQSFLSSALTTAAVTNQTLKMGIPKSSAPYHVKAGELLKDEFYEDDARPWEGLVVDYMSRIVAEARTLGSDLGLEYTWVSRGSRRQQSSRWTASVLDVQKGLIDMSAGEFWVTQQRLQLTAFTVPIHVDLMYLWVPGPDPNDPVAELMKVANPLSGWVWLCVIAAVMVVGWVDTWLVAASTDVSVAPAEGPAAGASSRPPAPEERTASAPGGGGGAAEAGGAAGAPQSSLRPSASQQEALTRYSRGVYASAMDLVGGGTGHEEGMGLAQRTVRITWGFFILILLSAYTANLASHLTKSKTGDYWRDVDEATRDGARICITSVLCSEAKGRWPAAAFVCSSGSQDSFDGVKGG